MAVESYVVIETETTIEFWVNTAHGYILSNGSGFIVVLGMLIVHCK
jgi:hypothetical protein